MNKEFLIFLFFLALSFVFWFVMSFNETYEKEYSIPINLVNAPKNTVMTTEMADTVRVTLRDKGFTLLAYSTSRQFHPLKINFESYSNKTTGRGNVPSADVQKLILKQMFSSSKIVSVKPDRFEYYFNFGRSKKVPIKVTGQIAPGQSHYLARTIFNPESVTVYASKAKLDSIKAVYTTSINLQNFTDTIMRGIQLRKITGAKFVPEKVNIGFYSDILTESSVEVPITPVNVPEGKVLRLFPSRVKVTFAIGAALIRTIKTDYFRVEADYNELVNNTSDKCEIRLINYPHNVKRTQLEFDRVDYLIEQQ